MFGGCRVIATYAEKLTRRGHEVVVVSTPPRPAKFRSKIKSLVMGRGWPRVAKEQASHFDRVDVDHRVVDRFRPVRDADVPDADVVIATWWRTAEWVVALSPNKGAKAYFIQGHEVFPGQPVERVKATWYLPMHKITIAKWLIELAKEEHGDSEVSLVPNSVDTQLFHCLPRGKQSQPAVGLMYSPFPIKGCDVSLRAFDTARRVVPDLNLVSFGWTAPTEELPLPAGARFYEQPPQQSIKDIYRQCDVWLCGSRTEGFHLPPLEAMACRCPVVSTRVGGPLDIIEEGVNGYLVDLEDSSALADRLVRVVTLSDSEWRAMSDAAHATAARYTWDDATDLFEAALVTAIDRARRGELGNGSEPRFAER